LTFTFPVPAKQVRFRSLLQRMNAAAIKASSSYFPCVRSRTSPVGQVPLRSLRLFFSSSMQFSKIICGTDLTIHTFFVQEPKSLKTEQLNERVDLRVSGYHFNPACSLERR